MAIEMDNKVGAFFRRRFVDCCPVGCQGNTKRVVGQWQSIPWLPV
jgi:hypothetical protein